MNKEKAFELLKEYLLEYNSLGFVFHSLFIKEFRNLLKEASGHEKQIFSLLIKQLSFVKDMGVRVNEADSNEKLKGTNTNIDYYSLHIQDKIVNIRMLITFENNNTPLFLSAFYERAGKRVTNYDLWILVIKERYEEMIGE